MFCHLSVDFRSSSVVPGGIKLNGLTDTYMYCNLAIQPGGGVGRVICDRVKNILPDSVHFVCSLTVSTLFVDEQSLLATKFVSTTKNAQNLLCYLM